MSGDQRTIRLEALGVPEPGLGAFTIDISYDPNLASPIGCQEDPGGSIGTVMCNTSYGPSTIRVGGFHPTSGVTGDIALADVSFRLVGQGRACGSLTPAAVEFADTKGQPITPLELIPGSLCVGGASEAATAGPAAGSSSPGGQASTPAGSSGTPGAQLATGVPASAGERSTGGPGSGTVAPGATPSSGDQRSAVVAGESTRAPGAAAAGQSETAETGSGGSSRTVSIVGVVLAAIALMLASYVVYRRARRGRLSGHA